MGIGKMMTTAREGLLRLLAIIFKCIIAAFKHNEIKGANTILYKKS